MPKAEDIIAMALRVFAGRVFLFLTLIAGIALFGWDVYDPSRERLWACIAYGLLVFLPVLVRSFPSSDD